MAVVTSITQSPAYEGQAASCVFTQPATAEADIYIDFGFVPSVAIVTVDNAASPWLWHKGLADGSAIPLYGAVDLAANGVTPVDTAADGAVTTTGAHILSGGSDTELASGESAHCKGVFLGTSVDGGNSATVSVVAWK